MSEKDLDIKCRVLTPKLIFLKVSLLGRPELQNVPNGQAKGFAVRYLDLLQASGEF